MQHNTNQSAPHSTTRHNTMALTWHSKLHQKNQMQVTGVASFCLTRGGGGAWPCAHTVTRTWCEGLAENQIGGGPQLPKEGLCAKQQYRQVKNKFRPCAQCQAAKWLQKKWRVKTYDEWNMSTGEDLWNPSGSELREVIRSAFG